MSQFWYPEERFFEIYQVVKIVAGAHLQPRFEGIRRHRQFQLLTNIPSSLATQQGRY